MWQNAVSGNVLSSGDVLLCSNFFLRAHTCAYSQWVLMHCFLSVWCHSTKTPRLEKNSYLKKHKILQVINRKPESQNGKFVSHSLQLVCQQVSEELAGGFASMSSCIFPNLNKSIRISGTLRIFHSSDHNVVAALYQRTVKTLKIHHTNHKHNFHKSWKNTQGPWLSLPKTHLWQTQSWSLGIHTAYFLMLTTSSRTC